MRLLLLILLTMGFSGKALAEAHCPALFETGVSKDLREAFARVSRMIHFEGITAIPESDVTSVDQALLDLLVHEIGRPVREVAYEYANGASMLALLRDQTGRLTPAIRAQSAGAVILQEPLSDEKRAEVLQTIRTILQK